MVDRTVVYVAPDNPDGYMDGGLIGVFSTEEKALAAIRERYPDDPVGELRKAIHRFVLDEYKPLYTGL